MSLNVLGSEILNHDAIGVHSRTNALGKLLVRKKVLISLQFNLKFAVGNVHVWWLINRMLSFLSLRVNTKLLQL